MKPSPTHSKNAEFFNGLSHKRRQMLCEILLAHGGRGLPVHRLQAISGLKCSTLTHHLLHMSKAGLIKRYQTGRETRICIDYAYFNTTLSNVAHLMAKIVAQPTRVAAQPSDLKLSG